MSWLDELDPAEDEVVVPPEEVARLKRLGRSIETVEEAGWDRDVEAAWSWHMGPDR